MIGGFHPKLWDDMDDHPDIWAPGPIYVYTYAPIYLNIHRGGEAEPQAPYGPWSPSAPGRDPPPPPPYVYSNISVSQSF